LLGQDVASFMYVSNIAEMKKENGRISMISVIAPDETLILVEDFCTRGTGFIEAVSEIVSKQPKVKILPYELVIINRGGLNEIEVKGIGTFKIVAVATHRVNDWDPSECPLCKMGSIPIKPKATDENWRDITTSQ
jgi:orotate phosphoribosyltransferase